MVDTMTPILAANPDVLAAFALSSVYVVCLIVGTLLTAINQGNFILSGDFQAAMVWKIPMTYAVPFIVATVGGLLNARAGISTSDARSK